MISKNFPETNPPRRYSLAEQARAFSVLLVDEFGVSFDFFDAANGTRLPESGDSSAVAPESEAALSALLQDGRARVQPLPDGFYRLALLLYHGGEPALVAVALLPALVSDKSVSDKPSSNREQIVLEKWAQAVSDRLRLMDQVASNRRREHRKTPPQLPDTIPWEALLKLEQLTRRLRIHRDSTGNIRKILEAAYAVVGAQTVAWVPRDPETRGQFHGAALMSAAELALLVKEITRSSENVSSAPLFFNNSPEQDISGLFPQVSHVLAFPVKDHELVGWLVAINKQRSDRRFPTVEGETPHLVRVPFRKTDGALLAPFAALLELHGRGNSRYQQLKDLLVGLTRSLTTAIDAKDAYTFGHSERVARIAVELGRTLDMPVEELGDVYLAGLLHDVGKIGIRDDVLRKPEPLTAEEMEHVQQHVIIGYSILAELQPIRNLLPGVLYHHERFDGTGYPDGLAEENIPMLARLLAVADAYDAMTTARPYRDPLPVREVEEILAEGAGSQWDPKVVAAFQKCRQQIHAIRQRGVGDSLRLALEGALRQDSDPFPQEPAGAAS